MEKLNRLENINPKLFRKCDERVLSSEEQDESVSDEFDSREIFDLIKSINDPEHPLSLEELNVLEIDNIQVDNINNEVNVCFTPTIPHCSMATLIGLSIQVQLLRALPSRFKVSVQVTPGSHASENAVNKQLADKERVAAALENSYLLEVINQCLTMNHGG
ncbi:MIP18 family protein galla-2 [Hetaerina americana]|uniref:MIP18 family protein galla-2 n=1 Tax=Hetaerina americana TaxID=62018 RepID=UPI003A7F132D